MICWPSQKICKSLMSVEIDPPLMELESRLLVLRERDVKAREPSVCQYFKGVESFSGRNFRGDKLLRTPIVKIKFGGYKLSRTWPILVKFSYFDAIFSDSLCNILRKPIKVRFCGYKLSRTPQKFAKSRKFLPAKLKDIKSVGIDLGARKF